MNTEHFKKVAKKHKNKLASGGIVALLLANGGQMVEKFLDNRSKGREIEAMEVRLNARIDEMKKEQATRDKAQWEAIARR